MFFRNPGLGGFRFSLPLFSFYNCPVQTIPPKNPSVSQKRPEERRHPLQRGLRVGIFIAVLLAGILGFITLYGVGDIQCRDECTSSREAILWGIGGAVFTVTGTAIVSVLVARSFGEWQMLRQIAANDMQRGSETSDAATPHLRAASSGTEGESGAGSAPLPQKNPSQQASGTVPQKTPSDTPVL